MFAILFEVLLTEYQDSGGNPSLCCLGGGVARGTKLVNKNIVNKLLICSATAFGPFSAEDANHASFPCLVSQEFPQTNLYEIRRWKHASLLAWLNMKNVLLVLFC